MANNNPHVEIEINTSLTGTGAPDATRQLDKLEEQAKDTARTMDVMEGEARELEKALRAMAVDSPEFQRTAEDLGKVRKEINETNRAADQYAIKAGGAAGASRNWGLATLEVSRAVEDAQYGMRGMLNNIPGLVMMLGGGGGLAGILSLAAVGGNLLYESLGKVKEEAADTEALDKLTAKFKKIAEAGKQLDQERKRMGEFDLAEMMDLEQQAIDRETKAFLANIEAIKRRIEAAGALDAVQTQNRIAGVDAKRATGEITAAEAESQINDIKRDAAARELLRAKELSKLTDQTAEAQKLAAEKRLEAAERSKKAAEAEIKAADEREELLIREQKARQNLASAIGALEAAMKLLPSGMREMTKEDLERGKTISEKTLEKGVALDPAKEQALLNRINAALDAMAKVEEARALDSGKSIEGIAVARQAIEDELKRLKDNLQTANDRFKEAQQGKMDADIDAENRRGEGEAERGDMDREAIEQGLGDALDRTRDQWDRAGEQAGEEISKVFEAWVSALGNSAEQPKVKELIESLREKISDGIQEGELEQIRMVAGEIVSKVNRVTSTSAQAFGMLSNVMGNHEARLITIKGDLKRLQEIVERGAAEKP
jgi:hypothetical protein